MAILLISALDELLSIVTCSSRGIGEYHLMTVPESDSANGQKSKKRRNELLEGERKEETEEKSQNITEDDLIKLGLLLADRMIEHQLADNGEYERQQKSEGTSMEKFGVEYHNVQREDEVMQEAHADSKTEDLPAATGENQEDQIDRLVHALFSFSWFCSLFPNIQTSKHLSK